MIDSLKPIEKNGSGRYEPRASGIVLSLGGAVAAIALGTTSMVAIGEYTATLEWTTDRAATAIKRQLDFERETNQRLLRLEITIAEIKTMLNERTARRESSFYRKEYLDESI